MCARDWYHSANRQQFEIVLDEGMPVPEGPLKIAREFTGEPVPEGPPKIARQFTGGTGNSHAMQVPEARLKRVLCEVVRRPPSVRPGAENFSHLPRKILQGKGLLEECSTRTERSLVKDRVLGVAGEIKNAQRRP